MYASTFSGSSDEINMKFKNGMQQLDLIFEMTKGYCFQDRFHATEIHSLQLKQIRHYMLD